MLNECISGITFTHNIIKITFKRGFDNMINKEKNTRTNITFPKELKDTLMSLAKKDDRSFNNLIIHILNEYLKQAI